MKTAAIYYFSGTTNTELVGKMIKEEFSKSGIATDFIRIEDILKHGRRVETYKYDLIGIGCQVIGYGVPKIVNDFVKLLPKQVEKKTFIFRTAGGVALQNYNASKALMRSLGRKGYNVFYERLFAVNSNWIVKYDDATVQQLFEATKRKAAIMCEEVISGAERKYKTCRLQQIKMWFIRKISSVGLRLVVKDLKVENTCSHCGICVKNCPSGNICEKGGKIKFKLSCSTCLRCVYSCPKSAIKFKHLKFIPIPGGYDINKILNKSAEQCENGRIPSFAENYIINDMM